MSRPLPAPPASLVQQGQASHGRYAGLMDRFDWADLPARHGKGRVWQWLHHKRWQYVGLATEQVFIGLAIVDVGWCHTAFAYVFDRQTRRLLADWSADGLPKLNGAVRDEPVLKAHSTFRAWGSRLAICQVGDALQVQVHAGGIDLEASLSLQQAPPFLLAVGPIEGGMSHATQKSPGLPVKGHVSVAGQRFDLDGAMGCLDSSNGLLAHDTAWRWACAHGRDVGFNLQDGYFGNHENVLWLDRELIPLGAARFEFDASQPLKPWRVWTDDGLLDLSFQPEGARQQDRNLGFAASHYVQPVGTFAGTVKASQSAPPRVVTGLVGVTEDHRSRW